MQILKSYKRLCFEGRRGEDFRTNRKLLEDGGLRADVQDVPTLEGIDRLIRHEQHVRRLKVERFRLAPIESHDRIERRGH